MRILRGAVNWRNIPITLNVALMSASAFTTVTLKIHQFPCTMARIVEVNRAKPCCGRNQPEVGVSDQLTADVAGLGFSGRRHYSCALMFVLVG